jgi:hydrogenase maturation protease
MYHLKTLLFGYGNADREDDGVAWHILKEVMRINGLPEPADLDIDYQDELHQVDYLFQLQLTPEFATDLAKYDRVCFIDAHTGAVPEEVHFEEVHPKFQKSPFTHHLTAASLLSIVETLQQQIPETILVSVRGYQFGFARELSDRTALLCRQAADIIVKWMQASPKNN